MNEEHLPICVGCYSVRVEYARRRMSRPTCMSCGEREARAVNHCVVPLNKSNYVHVRDRSLLSQLNPKRT